MRLIILLLLPVFLYGQKRDSIRYEGVVYKVEKIKLLYQDTIYFCNYNTNFRFTKDSIYVYKPKYYKKIKIKNN
jgi:hypothetical protein